jgi:hypothetical protein
MPFGGSAQGRVAGTEPTLRAAQSTQATRTIQCMPRHSVLATTVVAFQSAAQMSNLD